MDSRVTCPRFCRLRRARQRCAGLTVWAFLAHAAPAFVRAQTPAEPKPPPTAAASDPVEIVVTGTRIEERASESLVTTDVIRREEIEKSGARNAAEVLEERAGATIVRSFGGSALLLRGLDPEYTLVLVDGDRVPSAPDEG